MSIDLSQPAPRVRTLEEAYRVFNGVPRASHEQFVGFIKNKYQTDDTTSKKYVGFSVTKGRIAEGVNNRHAVDPSAQSASANEIKIQPSHLRSIQAFLSVSANSSSPQKK